MLAGYDAGTLNYYMRYFSQWLGLPDFALEMLASIESSYDPETGQFINVCNSSQACGLFQLKPIALLDIRNNFRVTLNPLDPIHSIVGAALLLYLNRRYITNKTGQVPDFWALVLSFNGGWTAGAYFMTNGRAYPGENSTYLAKVINYISAYA